MDKPRQVVLIILDGWGHRDNAEYNAIAAAHKPTWDMLWERFPHRLIMGSGHAVGLPEGQMGNSEVGHLNMGAGRVIQQDLTRIDDAIKSGEFFKSQALRDALQAAKKNGKAVHVMGLLSPGGVHSHESHFHAVVQLAAELGVSPLYFHVFLDGRDTPPRSAKPSLQALEACCARYGTGQIVSLIGRYFAMDRDKRWDRVEAAYDLIVTGKAAFHADQAETGLALAYARDESDEFVQATSIHAEGASPVTVNDGDIVIFMNFRADRARQLTRALTDPNFDGFQRKHVPLLGEFLCLTEYDARFKLPLIFKPISLHNILGEYISNLGMKQLRIAETEKYAHVTFFFNGGRDEPYPGEDRLLIPSPNVATYDLQPEMSAPLLADEIVSAINRGVYNLIVCNFANADMVGHTGNVPATVKAIEALDEALKKIFLALQAVHGEALITADHGNAEQMYDPATNQAHTAHTSFDVPLIYIGRPALMLPKEGKLSDIAPTLLYLLGLEIPPEMTGSPLLGLV